MTVAIDITLEATAWSAVAGLDDLVRRTVATAADEGGLDPGSSAELSVLLCDDAAIRALNKTWRGKDKATNVLSFPAAPSPRRGAPRLLGDIAIAFETTANEAVVEHKALDAHLSHLLVHGVLHLLDQDHEDEASAAVMESMERRVLARLGYADPYAGSEPERLDAS